MNKTKVLFSAVYMALIFYLSSIPNLKEPYVPFDPNKLTLHFLEYTVLGFLLSGIFKNHFTEALIGVSYGISDEIHQKFVPGRFCDPLDALADSLGVVFGLFLFDWFIKSNLAKNRLISKLVQV